MDFDKPRYSASTPSLAVFEGKLRCAYRFQESGYVGMVNCIAFEPDQMPVHHESYWHYEWVQDPFPVLGGGENHPKTVALVRRETSNGPALFALGTGTDPHTDLRYAE